MADTRVRIAPSPTGDPHVGTAYTALFNLAFARATGGTFVLRIEDTDRTRFAPDSEQAIFDTLRWLGLDWDEGPDVGGRYGPYRQSERLDRYAGPAQRLLADGHAYHCWCSPQRLEQMRAAQRAAKQPTGYDRCCLGKTREQRAEEPGFTPQPVLRLLVPDDPPLSFVDLVRGSVHAPHPDDQVIVKADGFPTYHLANVVDDHEMAITHVIRGEEWISSTPKHLLIYDFLGWARPAFAHLPLLRNADRSKISKRKNPAARLTWFAEQGYLPEALRNFLALMGYALPDGREVFSLDEMIATFDFARVNPAGPVFDLDKLAWLNGHYLRALPTDELAVRMVPYLARAGLLAEPASSEQLELLRAAAGLVAERMTLLSEAADLLGFLLTDAVSVPPGALSAEATPVLAAAQAALAEVEVWEAPAIEAALRTALVDGLGLKPRQAFAPIRLAVTGRTVSPPLFESLALLGRPRTLQRLAAAAG